MLRINKWNKLPQVFILDVQEDRNFRIPGRPENAVTKIVLPHLQINFIQVKNPNNAFMLTAYL